MFGVSIDGTRFGDAVPLWKYALAEPRDFAFWAPRRAACLLLGRHSVICRGRDDHRARPTINCVCPPGGDLAACMDADCPACEDDWITEPCRAWPDQRQPTTEEMIAAFDRPID